MKNRFLLPVIMIIVLAIATDAMAAYDNSYDTADYAATGYTAQGSMAIDTYIPPGCVDTGALEVGDPVVGAPEMYTYDELEEDIAELLKRYAGKLRVRTLAVTRDGRRIYELQVGNSAADTHIQINGAIHAREYITSNLCMKQLEYILFSEENGAFDGKSIRQWLSEVCIHFVPMINPDGVSISQFGPYGIRKGEIREKLLSIYESDLALGKASGDMAYYFTRWKANANGVNLNGNFNSRWYGVDNTAPGPSCDGYKGRYPHSETETRAMSDLSTYTHFKAVINYHSTGGLIYWDISENKLREHCRDLANNIMLLTGYTMAISDDGGGYNDYLKTNVYPSTSLSVEVGSLPAPNPASEMALIWPQNKFVPHYTMKWAVEKGK